MRDTVIKKNKDKEIKLYNMIMPLWLMLLMPYMWGISIIGSFLIDLLVLGIFMKVFHIKNIKIALRKSLLKAYIIGLVSDFIGYMPMLLVAFGLSDENKFIGKLQQGIMFNPFSSLGSFMLVTFSVILAGVMIYNLNFKFAFNSIELDLRQKRRISISMAVFTAPYLFYLPTDILK